MTISAKQVEVAALDYASAWGQVATSAAAVVTCAPRVQQLLGRGSLPDEARFAEAARAVFDLRADHGEMVSARVRFQDAVAQARTAVAALGPAPDSPISLLLDELGAPRHLDEVQVRTRRGMLDRARRTAADLVRLLDEATAGARRGEPSPRGVDGSSRGGLLKGVEDLRQAAGERSEALNRLASGLATRLEDAVDATLRARIEDDVVARMRAQANEILLFPSQLRGLEAPAPAPAPRDHVTEVTR